jgi:hypothetical protein
MSVGKARDLRGAVRDVADHGEDGSFGRLCLRRRGGDERGGGQEWEEVSHRPRLKRGFDRELCSVG